MEVAVEFSLVDAIQQYGFPIVMMVGLGYFIYYVWWFIGEKIEPKLEEMHFALIRVIDQTRMLDQDTVSYTHLTLPTICSV